jgi:pheromone shutdown protein TraB
MGWSYMSSNSEFEKERQQAGQGFKTVSDIRQRLDILAEHVESRKEALEEEIQEHLHESLANARDSMERIEENIAPKVEKAIRTKLGEIDRKLALMQEDGLEAVREELKKATPHMTEKIMAELDQVVAENIRFTKMEILGEVKGELKKSVESALEPIQEKLDKGLSGMKALAITALILSGLALLGVIALATQ